MRINTCFVIMGFNIKRNEDGKEYNLNESFEKIIKPVLIKNNISFIRADEIMITEIIDESMYQLLLNVDLVIADITTLNPNALYELGVRFALKPFSTIIIADKNTKFPFDINHLRIFTYTHGGDTIEKSECKRIKKVLNSLINNLYEETNKIDSPVYQFIKDLVPPQLPLNNNYFAHVSKRFKSTDSFCTLVNSAYKVRENGDFEEAINLYEKALKINHDEYVIKEIAMCMYQKGDLDNIRSANKYLCSKIDINNTLSPEILKTAGTINKKLWFLTNLEQYAYQAFRFYEKSFVICNSYNSGLNYGLMSLILANINYLKEKNTFYRWGKLIYKKVADICLNSYDINDYWINASLEECYYALKQNDKYFQYKNIAESLSVDKSMNWKRIKTLQQIEVLEKIR